LYQNSTTRPVCEKKKGRENKNEVEKGIKKKDFRKNQARRKKKKKKGNEKKKKKDEKK
jgi:hypothetical protein